MLEFAADFFFFLNWRDCNSTTLNLWDFFEVTFVDDIKKYISFFFFFEVRSHGTS